MTTKRTMGDIMREVTARDPMTVDDDMVARRVVLRREVWDQLVAEAERLSLSGTPINPTDLAVVALELGLQPVRDSAGQPTPRKRKAGR